VLTALRALAMLALVAASGTAAAGAATVVEYYNRTLDHYFISPLAADIDALDAGHLLGWSRTGRNFVAFGLAASDFPAGLPVCRWYIPPQHGDSHFFSASPDECAAVAAHAASDPNYSGYVLETPAAFFSLLPDAMTGVCAAGSVPLYRVWNQRADSNHRYVTDLALRDAMLAHGYAVEGYGPLGVAMCVSGAALGDAVVTASAASPYPAGCDGGPAAAAVAYVGAEVEPMLAVDPQDNANLVAAWQQDRWSDGGARGLRTGYSRDGGRTWQYAQAAFTHCSGGNAANGGDYARASDPWVSVGPGGIAYQIAIAFTGSTFAPGSVSAVLASRSVDGGATWSAPATLMRDGPAAFNDKESITADPTDARYAYAVWDRIVPAGGGPTWFTRTTDGGVTWEPARAIFTPAANGQTINNQVVVQPDGTLVLFFTQISPLAAEGNSLGVMRSVDKGVTWSAPTFIAQVLSVGTRDPGTGVALRDAGLLGSITAGRDGSLAVVWQDGRFSAGTIEGIAFSRSVDGGLTWSAPVQVNRVPSAPALLPAVSIRDDGTIGVLYYDLRHATPAATTLPADVWLVQSSDGVTWRETHVDGPFDFRRAPLVREDGGASAFFVGDYQALATRTSDAAPGETPGRPTFLPLFVQAQPPREGTNATDVFAGIVTRGGTATAAAAQAAATFKARAAEAGAARNGALRAAASRKAARVRAGRLMGTAAIPRPSAPTP
jgi:hypothetical protein